MARQKPDDVDKELKKQDAGAYGDEVADEPIVIDDVGKDTYGNIPDPTQPVSIASEVNHDEEVLAGLGDDQTEGIDTDEDADIEEKLDQEEVAGELSKLDEEE